MHCSLHVIAAFVAAYIASSCQAVPTYTGLRQPPPVGKPFFYQSNQKVNSTTPVMEGRAVHVKALAATRLATTDTIRRAGNLLLGNTANLTVNALLRRQISLTSTRDTMSSKCTQSLPSSSLTSSEDVLTGTSTLQSRVTVTITATETSQASLDIPTQTIVSSTVQSSTPVSTSIVTSPLATTAGSTSQSSAKNLQLSLVNSLADRNVTAYLTGLDVDGKLVLLLKDGSWYYPESDPSGIPAKVAADVGIGLATYSGSSQTTHISLPGYITGARLWFAVGTLQFSTVDSTNGPALVEPAAANPHDANADTDWGFIELTTTSTAGLYADLSFVDFVGLPLAIQLSSDDLGSAGKQSARGLASTAVQDVCDDLDAQSTRDSQPWNRLCVKSSTTGKPLRVLSPTDYLSLNSTAFTGYYDAYVEDVWQHYTANTLLIDTQASPGIVNCTVQNDELICSGDSRGYAKPTTSDIWGCDTGPFSIEQGDNDVHIAVVPRLCAAFNRGALLAPGESLQPSGQDQYYTTVPMNWYSATVHKHELDGKGYAFAYDDVVPDRGLDTAGFVASQNPVLLTVTVGGSLTS